MDVTQETAERKTLAMIAHDGKKADDARPVNGAGTQAEFGCPPVFEHLVKTWSLVKGLRSHFHN